MMPDLAAAAKPVPFNRWETLITSLAAHLRGVCRAANDWRLITAELVVTAYAIAVGQRVASCSGETAASVNVFQPLIQRAGASVGRELIVAHEGQKFGQLPHPPGACSNRTLSRTPSWCQQLPLRPRRPRTLPLNH